MTSATAPQLALKCPFCGHAPDSGSPDAACTQCQANSRWQDYARAIDFASDRFADWQNAGLVSEPGNRAMQHKLAAMRREAYIAARAAQPFPAETPLASPTACWRCRRPIAGFHSFCKTCGAALGEQADALRYLAFTHAETAAASGAQLTRAQCEACTADAAARVAALRAEMESQSTELPGNVAPVHSPQSAAPPPLPAPALSPAAAPQATSSPAASPRRNLLEILLDPRTIQWLLATGGVLLAVGVVIWLASLGIFKNEMVVAGAMGTATLSLLGAGFAVIRFTRHRLAGRALALLACLIMPLNLWFYHAHQLLTMEGHLWVAAVVCCVLYAAAAAILEDAMFVYVTITGVALTGLLILGDLHKLAEIAAPSTLLVALGLIALHVERAFADTDGPFSRKRFGLACFFSAQALLGAGLLLLLGSQIAGYGPLAGSWLASRPAIVTDPSLRLLAVALVLAGAYAELYSDLVVRRLGVYVYAAAFCFLWAALLVINLAHLTAHPGGLIALLALTSLAVNIVHAMLGRESKSDASARLLRPLPSFGLLLAIIAVLLGIFLHLRATRTDLYALLPYTQTWAFVAGMALAAAASRISAQLHHRRSAGLAKTYFYLTGASTLAAAAGVLPLLHATAWPLQLSVLMLIPTAYLLASRLYSGSPAHKALADVAQAATIVLVFSAIFTALNIAPALQPGLASHRTLWLALFCGEAAVFYALAAAFCGGARNVYLGTAMACAALWQLLNFYAVPADDYCLTFATIGSVLLIAHRFAARRIEAVTGLAAASFRCGNALLSLSFVSATLMSLSRFAAFHVTWNTALLLAGFAALALIAAVLVPASSFRRWYVLAAGAQGLLSVIAAEMQLHLSPWQHLEGFCVIVGLALLTAGYTLWYREQDNRSAPASFCLFFGSLLAGLPLALAAIINRFGYQVSLTDELGLVTVSTLMLLSGFVCRLRAPTLIGGSLLAIHLATLLVFAGMRAELAVGVYLALGGAALFALGLALSIYRDRLLALPRKIRAHEGVFGVLAWR
jgi:hypothetical protein